MFFIVVFSMQLAREVLDIAAGAIRPGVTTDEIDRIVHEVLAEPQFSKLTFCLQKLTKSFFG